MNIREFVVNLQKVYDEMSDSFSQFQKSSGLDCLAGCGKCCLNPEIEASPLEMLPMALAIYDQGNLDRWIVLLEENSNATCLVFNGQCSNYQTRPAVCRMFGVGGFYNKHHQPTLSICKYIKEEYPELAARRNAEACESRPPMIAEWTYKLTQLDPQIIQNRLPINQALKLALQKIALYAQYQETI